MCFSFCSASNSMHCNCLVSMRGTFCQRLTLLETSVFLSFVFFFLRRSFRRIPVGANLCSNDFRPLVASATFSSTLSSQKKRAFFCLSSDVENNSPNARLFQTTLSPKFQNRIIMQRAGNFFDEKLDLKRFP